MEMRDLEGDYQIKVVIGKRVKVVLDCGYTYRGHFTKKEGKFGTFYDEKTSSDIQIKLDSIAALEPIGGRY